MAEQQYYTPRERPRPNPIPAAIAFGALGDPFTSSGTLASTPAQNAAYNALATGGEILPEVSSAAPSAFSLSNIGAAGNAILPIAGALGALDLIRNDRGSVRGPLQGAASGAALGSYFGPVGIGVGAGVGGAAGLLQSLFGGKSRTNVEEKRREKLAELGVTLPMPKDEGIDPTSVFEKTRNEADLRPQDVQGYAAFFERVPGYQNLSLPQKLDISKRALDLGLIKEQRGTIDIGASKEFDDYVKTINALSGVNALNGVVQNKV